MYVHRMVFIIQVWYVVRQPSYSHSICRDNGKQVPLQLMDFVAVKYSTSRNLDLILWYRI